MLLSSSSCVLLCFFMLFFDVLARFCVHMWWIVFFILCWLLLLLQLSFYKNLHGSTVSLMMCMVFLLLYYVIVVCLPFTYTKSCSLSSVFLYSFIVLSYICTIYCCYYFILYFWTETSFLFSSAFHWIYTKKEEIKQNSQHLYLRSLSMRFYVFSSFGAFVQRKMQFKNACMLRTIGRELIAEGKTMHWSLFFCFWLINCECFFFAFPLFILVLLLLFGCYKSDHEWLAKMITMMAMMLVDYCWWFLISAWFRYIYFG